MTVTKANLLSNAVPPGKAILPKPQTFTLGEDADRLHVCLDSVGYFCSTEKTTAVWHALHNKPVKGAIIKGKTGSGKTYLPEKLHEILPDSALFYYQCQLHTDENDLIQSLTPDEDKISGIRLQANILLKAIEASKTRLTIVCIDEYDKSRPSTDTVMLEFLQRGGIHVNNELHQGNLDNLIVFLLANEEREMSDFIMRRMPVIYFSELEPQYAVKALSRARLDNPYLSVGYAIYKSLYQAGNVPKTITVQEIIQLIDRLAATKNITPQALDDLIYQFVSKDVAIHTQILGRLKATKATDIADKATDAVKNASAAMELTHIENLAKQVESEMKRGFGVASASPASPKGVKERFLKGTTIKLKSFTANLDPEPEHMILPATSGGLLVFDSLGEYSKVAQAVIQSSIVATSKTRLTDDARLFKISERLNVAIALVSNNKRYFEFNQPVDLNDSSEVTFFECFFKTFEPLSKYKNYGEIVLEYNFPQAYFGEINKIWMEIWNKTRDASDGLMTLHPYSATEDEILFVLKGCSSTEALPNSEDVEWEMSQGRLTKTAFEYVMPVFGGTKVYSALSLFKILRAVWVTLKTMTKK